MERAQRARPMAHYQGEYQRVGTRGAGKRFGVPGPRNGTNVRIVPGAKSGHWCDTGTLADTYLHLGAYWCRLDGKLNGKDWEIVVRPNDYEVLA